MSKKNTAADETVENFFPFPAIYDSFFGLRMDRLIAYMDQTAEIAHRRIHIETTQRVTANPYARQVHPHHNRHHRR